MARSSERPPLIVSAALTGGEHGRDATPHLPMTPAEIAASAVEAHRAGAAVVHIHVWDADGRPTQDVALFGQVRDLIRRECDAILNFTTGAPVPEEERTLPLELSPEIASFDAGSMNFGDYVFLNSPAFLEDLARKMKAAGTLPELEIFDEGMIDACYRLRDRGLLEDPLWFQFVLGVPGGAPASVRTLVHLASRVEDGAQWSVTGIGRGSVEMAMVAIALGGHVRVGLEDTIWYAKGELATSNAQLVARIARIAAEAGRPLATPAQARELLGLRARA